MKPHWLQVKNQADAAEILIQGQIGKDWFSDDGMAEKEFTDALAAIPEGKKIIIGINSEGGSVQDGLGIFNAIKRRASDITARIDGYAVSIASVIPLAASKVITPKSSIWMIHEPTMFAAGDATEMRRAADMLDVHAETITDIYHQEVGLSKEKAREMMKAETWFRGDEALEMGFADESNDEAAALNCFSPETIKHLRKIPENILKAIGNAGHIQVANNAQPVTPTASISDVGNAAAVEAENTNKQGKNMEDPNKTAAPAATPPAPIVIDFKPVIEMLERIENRLPKDAPKEAPPGAPPIPPSARLAGACYGNEGLEDHMKGLVRNGKKDWKARRNFVRDNWDQLSRHLPQNANTDTAAGVLTPTLLADTFFSVLQDRLAPLQGFTRNFSSSPTGRNVIAVPKCVAGGTAQVSPTSFEDTTNFVAEMDDVSITPAHIAVGAHLTNAEFQNGWRMAWFAEVKMGEFADKIQALVNAIITTGNFGAADFTGSYTGFGMADLRPVWAVLKKSRVKNIMLDAEYYAQFIPNDLNAFNPMDRNSIPGWDGFYLNTYWTGATANTIGFACNPQGIAIAAALPLEAPKMAGANNLSKEVMTVPDIGLSVATYEWFNPAGRVMWKTWECMFGAALGDGNAGSLLASA